MKDSGNFQLLYMYHYASIISTLKNIYLKSAIKNSGKQDIKLIDIFFSLLQDEYNLNPGLEWEDEFTGR